MYWSPNFLGVVFKKQEISQQAYRMQNLASEFSKTIFRGSYPRTLTADPQTQPGLWPDAGRKRPGVGTQTLVLLNFSAVVAPLTAVFVLVENQKARNTVHSNTSAFTGNDAQLACGELFYAEYPGKLFGDVRFGVCSGKIFRGRPINLSRG